MNPDQTLGLHQFKPGKVRTSRCTAFIEELHRVVRRLNTDKRRLIPYRLRIKLQDSAGNDPQSSFRPNEKLLQIVPRIVFTEAAERSPDPPIGKHHFKTKA